MDGTLIAAIAAAFLLAGFVKGVIGMGLPTVSLAVLAATVGLKEAMALMLIPSFVTNVWQALAGGHFRAMVKRLWPLLAAAVPAIWLGAGMLAQTDAPAAAAFLGVLIFLYSALALARTVVPAPGRHERWMSPVAGAVTGVITGLTGSFVMPAVLYMQALGLTRHELVQAMGISFTLSTAVLALALAGHSLLPADLGLLSAAALVPSAIGMVVGQWVRDKLSEERFRQVFFTALLLLGAWLAVKPWVL